GPDPRGRPGSPLDSSRRGPGVRVSSSSLSEVTRMSVDPNAPSERPFWNPYVAVAFLGLVLLSSFLVMGFGLGSSGAATRFAVAAAHLIAPKTVEANAYFSQYF